MSRARVGPFPFISPCAPERTDVNLKVSISRYYYLPFTTCCPQSFSLSLLPRCCTSFENESLYHIIVGTLPFGSHRLPRTPHPRQPFRTIPHRFHTRHTTSTARCLPQWVGIDVHTTEWSTLVPTQWCPASRLLWSSSSPRLPYVGHTRHVQSRTYPRKSGSCSRRRRTWLLRSD